MLAALLPSIGHLSRSMNISATLNVFSFLRNPSLCLPHATVSTFDRLPISVATALTAANGGQRPDIRAVVLDKDNCFARPKTNSIYRPYKVRPTMFLTHCPCQILKSFRKENQDQAF